LSEAAGVACKVADGVGLGRDVALTGPSVVGNALVWEDEVVPLALFATGHDAVDSGESIEGPTARRTLRSA